MLHPGNRSEVGPQARRPDDRYAPSLQVRAIEAYDKGGFATLVISGKQAFVERYAFDSPFWAQRKIEDAPEVAAQLKSNLKEPSLPLNKFPLLRVPVCDP